MSVRVSVCQLARLLLQQRHVRVSVYINQTSSSWQRTHIHIHEIWELTCGVCLLYAHALTR